MDPNETLREMRAISDEINDGWAGADEADAERLAELVEALDKWLVGGGFLPERWAGRAATEDDQ